ncbi:MAG: DegV family EDD domain-containing protein [Candidatus Marinimicrobia bacterium]|nr:DegV family EDD domain-containing protein [Candidatus Neomarinimicrobiota bacterium]
MKIIIDTTCQLEPKRIKDLGLLIVDYPLYLNGEEYEHYWDTPNHRELKDKYINLIRDKKSKGSTSGITEGAFIAAFESCKGDEILLIIQSISNTKATGNTLNKVLKEHPEFNVKAFDTEILASGVGAQGLALLRELKNKKLTRDECYELLVKNRANAFVVGVLYDLFYLHRSGRIGLAKAAVATAMGLYPILSSTPQSGVLKSTGKVRNFKQANARFIDAIKEQMAERNSKILTVTMAYSNEHNKECLHMKDILEKTAEELNWDIQVDINYTNFSLIPHMGPDFYEMGYVIGT